MSSSGSVEVDSSLPLSLSLPLPLPVSPLASDDPQLSGSKSHSRVDSVTDSQPFNSLQQPSSATRNISLQPVTASQIQISASGSGSESDSSHNEEKLNSEDSTQENTNFAVQETADGGNEEKKENNYNHSSSNNTSKEVRISVGSNSRKPTQQQIAPSPDQGPNRFPLPVADRADAAAASVSSSGVSMDSAALSMSESPELMYLIELSRDAPLNGVREAIKLNRLDFIKRIVEGFQSGKLTHTSVLRQSQTDIDESAELKKKKVSLPPPQLTKIPLTLRLLLHPTSQLLNEELKAFQFVEQQNAAQKAKKSKKNEEEMKREAERSEKQNENRTLESGQGDSNLHFAVRTAAKFQSDEVLAYLLQLLFPQGSQAVAVDLDNLDNSLAISVDQNSPLENLNKLGSSPLNVAVADLKVPISAIRLLLEFGADTQSRTLIGNQSLHIASYIGNVQALELILNQSSAAVRSAMITDCNLAGLTPIDYARTKQIKTILEQTKIAHQLSANQTQGKESAAVSRSASLRQDNNSASPKLGLGSKK